MPELSILSQSDPPRLPGDVELFDIVDPVLETSSFPWAFAFVLLALLLLAVAFASFFLGRYSRKAAARTPPEARALERLDRLAAARGSLEANRYAQELSDILKDFLAEKFGDPIRYETAEEFLARASEGSSSLPDAARHELKAFLEGAEAVKFAKLADAGERLGPLEELARQVVKLGVLVGQARE